MDVKTLEVGKTYRVDDIGAFNSLPLGFKLPPDGEFTVGGVQEGYALTAQGTYNGHPPSDSQLGMWVVCDMNTGDFTERHGVTFTEVEEV